MGMRVACRYCDCCEEIVAVKKKWYFDTLKPYKKINLAPCDHGLFIDSPKYILCKDCFNKFVMVAKNDLENKLTISTVDFGKRG